MSKRKGFTLIEIMLFLAVTAALFMGVAWGMQNTIEQQRYYDSTQSFLEFMRSIYSKVSNPQSQGEGNSLDKAIYGKLVVFGEDVDLLGNKVSEGEYPIFTYDVVGDVSHIYDTPTGSVMSALKKLKANVVADINGQVDAVAPERYDPRWGALIENTGGSPMTASILVVRHPRSGTINTLYFGETIQVNEKIYQVKTGRENANALDDLLTSHLSDSGGFNTEEADFCVNPYGKDAAGSMPKQDIRILKNARNASSVEMIDMDDNNPDTGNRCN